VYVRVAFVLLQILNKIDKETHTKTSIQYTRREYRTKDTTIKKNKEEDEYCIYVCVKAQSQEQCSLPNLFYFLYHSNMQDEEDTKKNNLFRNTVCVFEKHTELK